MDKDKTELYKTIEQLDAKKRHELIIAHQQINAVRLLYGSKFRSIFELLNMFKDFGSIYSTLLPGATAELVPPSGEENCLAGLEFRIAFSGKYKESLTELSGGQRSLVALSLILAMLKFKPAPFYILDEVSYLNSNTVILNIIIYYKRMSTKKFFDIQMQTLQKQEKYYFKPPCFMFYAHDIDI